MPIYWPDKYKTQRMYDEAAVDYLAALKFIPDCFVISKMIEKLLTALYADDNMRYVNEDSSDVIFCCNEMGRLIIDLNSVNLDDTNYNEDDPETIIHVILLA